MKKISSFILAVFAVLTVSAQLVVQVQSPGVVKLTYGASSDYSIYSPGFEVPTFWVHVWSTGSSNSTGTTYEDSWTNSNVTMNWDSSAGAYVGTIDLNNKVFTNGDKTFPSGTTVNNLGFVFKNQQNGATNQSGDLTASNFGFTSTVTDSNLGVSDQALNAKSHIVNGKLYTAQKGNLSITVYEMSGKLVKNFNANSNGGEIDLNISKSGLYIAKITNGAHSEVVKFKK